MKFFSSFDTQLKHQYIDDFSTRYGKDNIVVIQRSNLYFLKKVAIHVFLWLLSYIIRTIGTYFLLGEQGMLRFWWRSGLFFLFWFLTLAGENYIDYKMNYAIFTPHEAIMVEQLWFFKRNIKSLDIKKIKSISIKKSNRLFSLFDDGLLSILNEWSHSINNVWEMVFKYVNKPEAIKDKIQYLISLNQQQPITTL